MTSWQAVSKTGWTCPGTALSRLETYTAAAAPAHSTCGLARCGGTVPLILGYSFLSLLSQDCRDVGANATPGALPFCSAAQRGKSQE